MAVLVLAGLATGCGARQPADAPVARFEDVAITAGDLLAALGPKPDRAAALRDRALVEKTLTDILVDELVAKEARARVPGAEAHARDAERRAAIQRLLEVESPSEEMLRAHFADTRSRYGQPAQVRLAWIVLDDCAKAQEVREEIEKGALSFEAAAVKYSTERASATQGGEVGWRAVSGLPVALREAIDRVDVMPGRPALGPVVMLAADGRAAVLAPPADGAGAGAPRAPFGPGGTATGPGAPPRAPGLAGLAVGGRDVGLAPPGGSLPKKGATECIIPRVLERRAAVTPSFEEVRDKVRVAATATAAGTARKEMLRRLGGTAGIQVRAEALAALEQPSGREDEYAVIVGRDHITVGEARARLGAAAGRLRGERLRAVLVGMGEDLILWREAERRGLARAPEVRAAGRAALALLMKDRVGEEAAQASQPAGAIEDAYRASLGDYTEPKAVRLSALVTREKKKADAWAKALRTGRFPADAFEKLLPESEDAGGQKAGGDLGWVDGRSTAFPESFKEAVLRLQRPGDVAGPLPVGGVYMVVLCRDRKDERVRPFEEVEGQIREKLRERRREERVAAYLAEVRSRAKPVIDWGAIERLAAGR